jgi:hypothetical protein
MTTSKKKEDDLKKNGRPQKKIKIEDDLQKKEDNLIKLNGRRPQTQF